MLKHIVAWQFTDTEGATRAENAAQAAQRLRALPQHIPSIRAFEVVLPQEGLTSSFDLALYSEFNDAEALEAYLKHPKHVEVAEFITSVRDERFVVDYDTDQLA